MLFVTFSDLRPEPGPHMPLETGVLDDAFRVAVCLGATDRVATVIAALAVRGVRLRVRGAAAAESRIHVLTRVVAESRIALASPGTRAEPPRVPQLATLVPAEREVLVLELACALTEAEIARVLGLELGSVRALRSAARRALVPRE